MTDELRDLTDARHIERRINDLLGRCGRELGVRYLVQEIVAAAKAMHEHPLEDDRAIAAAFGRVVVDPTMPPGAIDLIGDSEVAHIVEGEPVTVEKFLNLEPKIAQFVDQFLTDGRRPGERYYVPTSGYRRAMYRLPLGQQAWIDIDSDHLDVTDLVLERIEHIRSG